MSDHRSRNVGLVERMSFSFFRREYPLICFSLSREPTGYLGIPQSTAAVASHSVG